MTSHQLIYTGPSWAHSSYDPPNTVEYANPTSLAKEWNIPCLDLSKPGSGVLDRVTRVTNTKNSGTVLPIVWIYNEPLVDLKDATGMDLAEFVQRSDCIDIWKECNRWCLNKINDIGLPVLLIGGHCDIVDCDFSNITVGHDSWQKYIAELAGLKVDNNTVYVKMDDGGDYSFDRCWGAEVVHRFIHQHQNIQPSQEIVNAIWDIFFFWKELEKANLFFEVHPNKRANQEFAKFLLPVVNKFLQDTK